ncbi:hypothetical protein CC2G_003131 [Coprinopsis cinerea AmutBmut pab1-1]|nr:hypothetical protein CC2G_003131 [Coprinopsis cinerea AmutBmut pab1-1]
METTRHMNIVQLQSFASCNAKVEEPLQEMKRRVFVLLQQFGLYPEEVLTAMKDRCAIISGSAALSVVTPVSSFLKTQTFMMDIYVHMRDREALIQDLTTRCGDYIQDEQDEQPTDQEG